MTYHVIEILNRSLISVTPCDSHNAAIEQANTMLKCRMKELNLEQDLMTHEGQGGDWDYATKDHSAYLNTYNQDWDAHIAII